MCSEYIYIYIFISIKNKLKIKLFYRILSTIFIIVIKKYNYFIYPYNT